MAEPRDDIDIEVVWLRPEGPSCWRLQLPAGSTAAAALTMVACVEDWPQDVFEGLPLGIFARRVESVHVLQEGDRLEVYRPLQVDPKDARRRRAMRSR